MIKLTSLVLVGHQTNDVNQLASLTNLTNLDLSVNQHVYTCLILTP